MQKGDKITVRLGNRKQSGKILNTNTDSLAREEVALKFWLRKMEVWTNSGPLREGGRLQGDEGAHSLPTTQDPPPTTQPGLWSVQHLIRALTAVKPAKLSSDSSAAPL